MDIARRNIGVNYYDGKWTARLWSPGASQVLLKLETIDAPIQLLPMEHGYWWVETDKLVAGDFYWFVVDNNDPLPDPASLSQPEGVHGPSQALILSTEEESQSHSWNNVELKDYIIYDLHTGTFSDQGDFDGIIARLDHLVTLGITAIELMPIAAFPGERNWGYDGVFPFAVQSSYGGLDGLKRLITACHNKGLAVILDVVYNHLGPEGNYLEEFGPYMTDKYKTPWGRAINFDDRDCHGVREYFIENALMWFRDFGVDALRLDAVHAIKDYSALHILQELRHRVDALSEYNGRIYYLIAESDLNDPRYITPISRNGIGMHAQWADEFHHSLRVAAGQPKTGYYSDFSGVADLAKAYEDGYVYTGEYSVERGRYFGRHPTGQSGEQFIVFSQNHDQIGNRMLGERTSSLISFEMQKLMVSVVMCSPFLPMLFMGEEWSENNPFLYFIDHQDEKLVEQVRKGRAEEFSAMHNQTDAPDPKASETFIKSKLNWKLLYADSDHTDLKNSNNQSRHERMFAYYTKLIVLRKRNVALQRCDRSAVKTRSFEDKNCLIVERGVSNSKEVLVCLMNFSQSVQTLSIPQNIITCIKVADSASPKWLGPKDAPDQINPESNSGAGQNISIQPQSFIAYTAFYA